MPRTDKSERMFYEDISEGFFYALPVLLFLGTGVWALMSDDPWWSRILMPFVAFIAGLPASMILVLVAFLLEEYFPFWRRSFWRRSP